MKLKDAISLAHQLTVEDEDNWRYRVEPHNREYSVRAYDENGLQLEFVNEFGEFE